MLKRWWRWRGEEDNVNEDNYVKTNNQYQLDVILSHYLCKKFSMSKIKYEEVKRVKREDDEAERMTRFCFKNVKDKQKWTQVIIFVIALLN